MTGYTARIVGAVLNRDQRLAYVTGPDGEVRVRWRHRRVTLGARGYTCDECGVIGRYPQVCPHALAMSQAMAEQRETERQGVGG